MTSFQSILALGLLLAAQTSVSAGRERLPDQPGQCVATRIEAIGTRLVDDGEPIEGSGSEVRFSNGGRQVSYDTVAPIERSRPGDPARMCLLSLPRDCPAGDGRGRVYRTTNLRTGQSWDLPDSEHMCGGA